ncbi:thioesterase family protein [Nocardiopsis sp. CNT312]|uniref:thioesterase family protein n=1 Tax=Nocardiopsis sp. CNT312 TaxID=1137268 RepID=UPI00048B7906|nr:thioesterase family protein [Nocardiopsis sp. CNT312]
MSLDPTAAGFEFDRDTRVEKDTDGVFTAVLTDGWTTFTTHPNGGYVLATALNALRQSLSQPDPLVVSAFYLRPAAPGPAEIRTETVREGRRTATGQASLSQGGKEVVRATATYGDLSPAQGPRLHTQGPPGLPDPQECAHVREFADVGPNTIGLRVEYRYSERPAFLDGRTDGDPQMEFWMRFADGRQADVHALPAMADFAVPAVTQIGAYNTVTVELTTHVRARPAPGWLACRAFTRHVDGGFHEEDMEIWDSTGVLVAQARQLAILL